MGWAERAISSGHVHAGVGVVAICLHTVADFCPRSRVCMGLGLTASACGSLDQNKGLALMM